ncbi:MAG: hypothetical protein CR989_05020 [Flavobacteriales bacterium]|nr:MAG: hypothetical protein CR989_05020 [Flavobacteriales bacterium]
MVIQKRWNFYVLKYVGFLLYILLSGCAETDISGYYYDLSDKRILAFKNSDLIIYNLIDSIKINYKWKGTGQKLKFFNDSFSHETKFQLSKDSLVLIDENKKLIKINVADNLDYQLLYNNYWHSYRDSIDIWCQFLNKDGRIYFKEQNNTINFAHNFQIHSRYYFNKFHVFNFNSTFFNQSGYVLSSINSDSLDLISLYDGKKISFSSVTSKIDENIYGKWIKDSNEDLVMLQPDGKFFYFENVLIISKDNNLNFKDSKNKSSIDTIKIPFEIGINTKYLFLEEPLNTEIEIIKLNKDSLVFRNNLFTNPVMVRYIK